jgi:hypothetical protein
LPPDWAAARLISLAAEELMSSEESLAPLTTRLPAKPPRKSKYTRPKYTKAERRRWAANAAAKHKRLRKQLLATDDEAMLTFYEWIALNGLSERQGRRILAEPGGPAVTWLTDRKIGISRAANRAWLQSRSRSSTPR